MSFIVVIPARYASTRLPGKPLLDIAGKPMIQHVYERASGSSAQQVFVATDDQRIEECVKAFGGEVVITSDRHPSGTDRLEEVVSSLMLDKDAVIVNLQGDEPLLSVNAIEQVAANLISNSDCGMATLCEKIENQEDIDNPNVVKVVRSIQNRALYFSRAGIPCLRTNPAESQDITIERNIREGLWYRHIGLYAYRVSTLKQFVTWPPSKLELAESLEQLRALENGIAIHCEEACEAVPGGVDTQADLERIRKLLSHS